VVKLKINSGCDNEVRKMVWTMKRWKWS